MAERYAIEPLGKGEFTWRMLCNELNLSMNATKNVIERLLSERKIEHIGRRRAGRGRPENAYRMIRHEK